MSVSPPPKIAKGSVAPNAAICVKFNGLPQKCPWGLDDKLQIYFQNEKKSGGGDVDNVCLFNDDDGPYAIISFDKPETARNVLARTDHKLIINQHTVELFVELFPGLEDQYVHRHMSTEENDPIPCNLPDQSMQFNDGDMHCSSSMSSEWHHCNEDHRQPIQRDRPRDQRRQEHGDQPRLSSTTPDADSPLNFSRDSSEDGGDEPLQLLEVCFSKVSLDTVFMYFESRKRSGGADIKHYEEIQPGKVLIIFEQAGVAQNVCSKSHKIEGQTLEVSLIEETGPAQNTIEVSGFPTSIGEDTLEMYFESKRRSGGGDIKESNMNEDKTKFTIKFEEAEAMERVLNKVHEIERSKLTVNLPSKVRYRREGKRLSRIAGNFENPISEDAVNILVCFHQKMSLETVLMYFENKRRSGGGDILNHELLQPGNLVITFEKGVAEDVSTRPHTIDGQTLKVSLIEESGPSQNTVEVCGFPTSIGKDTLEMYFESERRSGGGDIKDCNMNKNKSIFTITFEDKTAVDRILARRHELSETLLTVHRPKKVWLYKHQVDKSVVEVHGDTSTSSELLQMYFENRARSGGGGDEVKVMYHENKKLWTVKFDNSEIADRVLQKSHWLNNKAIKVLRPQPMGMVPDKCNTADTEGKQEDKEIIPLEVQNVNQSISEEYLRLYFENHEKSCGGPIGLIKKNQKVAGNWAIYFQESGVSQAVAEQKDHELGGSRVTVSLGSKRVRRPLIDHCLLISDLPKKLNLEIFHLYLEKVIRQKQPKIKFGRVPLKAMVEYRDTINDIDDVISKIENEKLQNTKINAKKVFEVDTILVKNLDKTVTEEMLKLYFENWDRSGGGNIIDMQLDSKKLEVTIQFENYTVVKSVFKKKHRLQNKNLEVCFYHDDIGELVSDGCQWIPDPVSMPVDPYLFTFANTTPTFNVNLANAGIEVEHNPDDPCILKLHAVEGFDLNSISNWEDHAASNFTRLFSDQFDRKTLEIGDECFEDFQQYLMNEKTDGVKLIPDDSSPSLMILGLKDAVKTVWDKFSHELKVMNDKIERKKKTITERKQYKPIKIKKIQLLGFEEVAKSNYRVKMMVDDQNNIVSFEGLCDDVDSAMLDLYKQLENFAEVSFPLSARICQFLTDFYDKIISLLAKNNLHITYEIDGNRVKIYSTSDKDIMAAKSSIKEMIMHHKYPLPSDKMKVIKSADGKQLLDDLNSPGIVTVEVVTQKEGESCIMITGFDMAVKQVISKVSDFLSTNLIMEKKKGLERGMVRLLEKHHSKELVAIESALSIYFVKLKPSQMSSCIVIKGNRSGIDAAVEKIIGLESKVLIGKHLISQPGMATFFREDKGNVALESVENRCKCIIEFDGSNRYTSTEAMHTLLRHTLQNGIELIVCKADMTEMKVDVIVNAANDRLQHVGGLAKAIVDAGGKEIQEESNGIMRARGWRAVSTGEVILTGAGSLPCTKIIHTVGPRYTRSSNAKQMKRLLMSAVTCVYEEAEKNRFTSIGMPAISSGVYGYPLMPCTQAILEATKEYFEENPQSQVHKVYFLSVNIKVCQGFEAGMETVFNIHHSAKDDMFDESDSDHDFIDLTEADDMPTSSNPGLKINNDVVTTKEASVTLGYLQTPD
ncbi:protein mono-ADP-ribosyltransferase PARP14-like [Anneissia japonica]|uniref:protein mono-ADP-ribosyltransferase PARP14-like n=1 Tax=Anneissia japonica TaxID=1529436 RepID=UPI0014256519|nr:protein mono-ADP-ribosyltransferase PARP14-like [Anneissia japonica]